MIARPTDITHTSASSADLPSAETPLQRQILLWQRAGPGTGCRVASSGERGARPPADRRSCHDLVHQVPARLQGVDACALALKGSS